MKFKPGDTLQEKSSGPLMIVEEITPAGAAICVWFERGKSRREILEAILLRPYKGTA